MLIHIVIWKYRSDVPADVRESHIEKLRALSGLVPGIVRFEVGSDILDLDRSYDTGLAAAFADREALERYTVHPEHQKVASMGKEIAEHAASVDFII